MVDRLKSVGSIAPAIAIMVVLWVYYPTLIDTAARWADDPQYSHGFLVWVFAAYLLWSRRDIMRSEDMTPRWWGLGIVAIGAVVKFCSFMMFQPWMDVPSLLIVLAGVAAAAGGRGALRWSAPAILFCLFMIPLPFRAQSFLGGTLQKIATWASTYALQTLGVPAVSEGNIILLTKDRLGVVEACNGLSMLMTFFALAAGVVIVSRRKWFEKVILLVSAVPISIFANVVRITLTGVLFEADQGELANSLFHDFAGLLMMPIALGMLLLELHVMGRVFIEKQQEDAVVFKLYQV